MNKLELLRTFVRVTELSSFTQAGESLGLPRSTVSEHVQALEELLGARLLQRTTRKVQATQDGRVLYERSKDLLAHMEELEGLFRQDEAQLAGRIRVDLPNVMARDMLLPHLPSFMGRHPLIEMEISSTDRQVDLIAEGFDCVLRVGAQPDQTVVARRVCSMPMVNCVSPAYLQRHGMPETLADLAHHQLVHYVRPLGARSAGFEYQQGSKVERVAMAGRVTVNSTDAYQAACLGGFGIIQVPQLGIGDLLASGKLVAVLPDYPAPPLDVSLLYAGQRHLPLRVRVFMDWMAAILQARH
ncbi:LysR family transcriptional regulator [Pseudomonas sp. BCA14]|uniref:LysR family transcriptional regulator n=1 Tax=unclassified Pseudomonas TaxID=196821 RepID=UPI00106EC30E|nr:MULTISPECIES: LysR family transcriptional regulator [unclassified Pseudomonas]TFF06120.1 LysR family transcriptional regulator [Pseudomonas sp. JMN1]TFF08373.1 LysR family transcriptional regulator [Pseudomonas sp. BCA17]TFF23713.1 LysR family transcriptional regulator [Pseudomonas sp. BCA14]TFF27963.1 LysR family transcriptional regulator [Pseudomonas sp. BCA13]